MKFLLKLKFLVVFALLLTFLSCGNEEPEPSKTDAELIGSGVAWKLSTLTANGSNWISLVDDCLLDNLFTFYYKTGGNTGLADQGPTKCNPSDSQTDEFTWTYSEATSILTLETDVIEVPGSDGALSVVRVSGSELVLSQNLKIAGISQVVLFTLIH
jgi:hypothetical protein